MDRFRRRLLSASMPPLRGNVRWFDVVLAVVIAVVLQPWSAFVGISAVHPDWAVPSTVALVVAHISVVLRRHPLSLAACGLAMLVLLVADLGPNTVDGITYGPYPAILLPSTLTFVAVLYGIAAHADRPWPVVGLVSGLAGASITSVRLWSYGSWTTPALDGFDPTSPIGRLIVLGSLVALVVAAWALGRYRAVRAAYLVELEARAATAEAERERHAARVAADERTRIAREMHDVVAHALAVIVRQAEGGRLAGARDPDAALSALGTVASTGREALDDTRSVLGRLRSDGQQNPQHRTADDLAALVDRIKAAGLPVSLETTGGPTNLSRTASLAVYRVVQESLTNVVKHAGEGAEATVTVHYTPSGAEVHIVDHGGTDGSELAADTTGGHGILGMAERVSLEGGSLTARPTSEGFAVSAAIPARTSTPTADGSEGNES